MLALPGLIAFCDTKTTAGYSAMTSRNSKASLANTSTLGWGCGRPSHPRSSCIPAPTMSTAGSGRSLRLSTFRRKYALCTSASGSLTPSLLPLALLRWCIILPLKRNSVDTLIGGRDLWPTSAAKLASASHKVPYGTCVLRSRPVNARYSCRIVESPMKSSRGRLAVAPPPCPLLGDSRHAHAPRSDGDNRSLHKSGRSHHRPHTACRLGTRSGSLSQPTRAQLRWRPHPRLAARSRQAAERSRRQAGGGPASPPFPSRSTQHAPRRAARGVRWFSFSLSLLLDSTPKYFEVP